MTSDFEAHPLRVLLVEDSEPDVVLTTEAFDDAKIAVEVLVAKDGRVAHDLLVQAGSGERPVPELILLDLNLPKIDGLEILEFVKSHPVLMVIPVIVMTSSRNCASVIRLPLSSSALRRMLSRSPRSPAAARRWATIR